MNRPAKTALLAFFLSLCASATLVTHYYRSHTPAPAPRELFSVVNTQVAAFRSADFSRAYEQAATGVQQKFTLAQFEAMIRRDYAHMGRSHHIEFGFVKVQGASAVVQVFFFNLDGSIQPYLYSLSAEPTGWKIEGVQRMRPSPPGQRAAGLHV